MSFGIAPLVFGTNIQNVEISSFRIPRSKAKSEFNGQIATATDYLLPFRAQAHV